MVKIYSKTTFVTVNPGTTLTIGAWFAYSKTTFVTVNPGWVPYNAKSEQNSKTTFVTVNLDLKNKIIYVKQFKNNLCYF